MTNENKKNIKKQQAFFKAFFHCQERTAPLPRRIKKIKILRYIFGLCGENRKFFIISLDFLVQFKTLEQKK